MVSEADLHVSAVKSAMMIGGTDATVLEPGEIEQSAVAVALTDAQLTPYWAVATKVEFWSGLLSSTEFSDGGTPMFTRVPAIVAIFEYPECPGAGGYAPTTRPEDLGERHCTAYVAFDGTKGQRLFAIELGA